MASKAALWCLWEWGWQATVACVQGVECCSVLATSSATGMPVGGCRKLGPKWLRVQAWQWLLAGWGCCIWPMEQQYAAPRLKAALWLWDNNQLRPSGQIWAKLLCRGGVGLPNVGCVSPGQGQGCPHLPPQGSLHVGACVVGWASSCEAA